MPMRYPPYCSSDLLADGCEPTRLMSMIFTLWSLPAPELLLTENLIGSGARD